MLSVSFCMYDDTRILSGFQDSDEQSIASNHVVFCQFVYKYPPQFHELFQVLYQLFIVCSGHQLFRIAEPNGLVDVGSDFQLIVDQLPKQVI